MYNQIMESVIEKLKTLFPDVSIDTAPVEEGETQSRLETGISQVSEKCVNGQRYCCTINIFVNYYPQNKVQCNLQCYQVLNVLMDNLEHISLVNGSIIGSNGRNGTFDNGNLKFQAEYLLYFLKSKEKEDSMVDVSLR